MEDMQSSASSASSPVIRTTTVSSIHLTLPLACQVCLGKVRDPVVCTNQHAFCSACMTQWLNVSKSHMCPTCRVPVTDKQPCKRILGSMDVSPTAQDKSFREQMRRTRFELLFKDYEKEISTLEQHLEECRTENSQIKEINMDLKARLESTESRLVNVLKSGPKNDKNCDNFSQDIDTILKLSSRLQEMNNSNKSLKDENETLKEDLREASRRNDNMKEEIDRLSRAANYNMSPQKFSRYTLIALQTKVDNYEREVNRLRRALERSDEYIEEIKRIQNIDRNNKNDTDIDHCFPSQMSSAQIIKTATHSSTQVSRIDELASVALAAQRSPADPAPSYPVTLSDQLSKRKHTPPTISQCSEERISGQSASVFDHNTMNCNGLESIDSASHRSIFEDSSKFPACAKLIELTKVRRDLDDHFPADVVPLDSPGNAVVGAAATSHIDEDILVNMNTRQSPQDEATTMATLSRESLHFSEDQPILGDNKASSTEDMGVIPPPLIENQLQQSTSGAFERMSPQRLQSKSYPSSVVLPPESIQFNGVAESDEDVILAKRIKIEQPES